MQQQPYTAQPNIHFENRTTGNAQKTLYCIFSNYHYFHTCEGHVSNGHTGATCKTPGPNHNCSATQQNMQGGSTTGMHKTIMPEQCGQIARRKPQCPVPQGYLSWKASGFQGTHRQHNSQFEGQRQQQHQQQPAYPQANMMALYVMPTQIAPQFMAP